MIRPMTYLSGQSCGSFMWVVSVCLQCAMWHTVHMHTVYMHVICTWVRRLKLYRPLQHPRLIALQHFRYQLLARDPAGSS